MIGGHSPSIFSYKLNRNLFLNSFFTLTMLFYNLITDKEGKDNSEGEDSVRDTKLNSNQCITCRYYYYNSKNFNNNKNICDGCYYCVTYENENPGLIFRIVTLKKGAFETLSVRTVSDYFLVEIEKILKNSSLTKDFGWIYKKTE